MSIPTANPPGIFRTVAILLRAARQRALARGKRQHRLIEQRTGRRGAKSTGMLTFVLLVIIMIVLHGVFALGLKLVSSARLDGRPDVSERKQTAVIEQLLSDDSSSNFLVKGTESRKSDRHKRMIRPHFSMLEKATPVSMLLGSFVLLWWFVMMLCQGEGLELDLQRRRHPMWEWLFSHPVPPGGIFLAEMLSPIAANPIFIAGPIFWGLAFGFVYSGPLGFLSLVLIGVPITVTVAAIGKAIDIGVTLRFPPRSRGAVLGIMSWLGYALMMAFVFCIPSVDKIYQFLAVAFEPYANVLLTLPFRLLFGIETNRSTSYASALLFVWCASLVLTVSATAFAVWAARLGIAGESGDSIPKVFGRRISASALFQLDPLYRKELLWLRRDGSALVQTLLLPLTIASFQLINMRGAIEGVQGSWNFLCGAAIILGTYFLWTLGPKSLASEGPALWIASTWPRGLESLLKAKARLWSLIATVIVFVVLLYAAALFPNDAWKILLVGMGWAAFSRTMAEKSVTLVSVPSPSGDPEPIPKGRRWAASLGMLTFSIGVLSQNPGLATTGIVYSWLTAGAMWQNFRARIPFLYDPWSEKLPPPPTLMHSMITVSCFIELGAIVMGISVAVFGAGYSAAAQPIIYSLCGAVIAWGALRFFHRRGLVLQELWRLRGERKPLVQSLILALIGGVFVGVSAQLYFATLLRIPEFADLVLIARQQARDVPVLFIWSSVFAIAVAPFIEEFLFRGLLYRALEAEWGGWGAVGGSAIFFAVYHPPLFWVPIAMMGGASALLFRHTGRLESCILLHVSYSAIYLFL